MRPVIVGIAPSREGAEGQPLSALGGRSTGATLAQLAGLRPSEYMRRFDRVNLCPTVRPSTIAIREGRPMAEMLAGSLLRGRRVVLLGANVAECFGLRDPSRAEPCRWYALPEGAREWWGVTGFKSGFALPFTYAVLPHPSGRNRWYNEPENRARAERLMRDLATEEES